MSETQNLLEQLAFALANHDVDMQQKAFFLSSECVSNSAMLLTLTEKYERKLKGYASKFHTIFTDGLLKTSFEHILERYHHEYDSGTWHTWTSEDMILELLQEFVRLFHAQEVGKEREAYKLEAA